MFIFTCKVTS